MVERVRLKPENKLKSKRKYLGEADKALEQRRLERIQELFKGGKISASGIPEFLDRRLWV